jgi:hypothetical protein
MGGTSKRATQPTSLSPAPYSLLDRAGGTSTGGMMKLPILESVKETYAFVWRERRLFWTLAMPAIVLISLLGTFGAWAFGFDLGLDQSESNVLFSIKTKGAKPMDTPPLRWEAGLSGFAITMVWIVATVMYMVAWHRVYLVPSIDKSAAAAYRWNRRQGRFVWAYIKATLLIFAVSIVVMVPAIFVIPLVIAGIDASEGGSASSGSIIAGMLATGYGLSAIIGLVCGWFFARWSLAFPAAAIDNSSSMREAWKLSDANGWSIFWVVLLTTLPATILGQILSLFGVGYLVFGTSSLTLLLLGVLFYNCVWFLGVALGVTALSVSYQRLSSAPIPTTT